MTILDKIIARKTQEVAQAKAQVTTKMLEASPYFDKITNSLKDRLLTSISVNTKSANIIAEFKRKSPSKGIINDQLSAEFVTTGYAQAGAVGLSVLTDTDFFGGSQADLLAARTANPSTALLRKDFMIDEYQLLEAKAWGADVVLLIAANLSPIRVLALAKFAKTLGLETLLEIHDQEELDRSLSQYIDIVGVNNRNLKNFAEQNVDASLGLAEKIPVQFPKISESCISAPSTVKILQSVGYHGFLIGENFMKTQDPGHALTNFLNEI
jgi:indole-3-glycerol phosphate synthase